MSDNLPVSDTVEKVEISKLYVETSVQLRRLLVRKLGNPQDAEDIANDAYLKLCRIQNNADIRDLRKYLFTMAIRLALNVLRKRKLEKQYLKYHEFGDIESEENYASAYRILLAELKLNLVREALLELPEKTRYIFLMHRFEGLTYTQIADRTSLSTKAVEYHMSRALDKVMQAVSDLE